MLTTESSNILGRLEEALSSATLEVFGQPAIIILSTVGLSVMVVWLLRYQGLYALQRSPVRRNRMNILLPIGFLFLWLGLMALAVEVLGWFFRDRPDSFAARLASYSANALIELFMVGLMLTAAFFLFARGIKGLGLRVRTLAVDSKWATVYLLAVYPLIFIGLWLVLLVGRLVKGMDFSIIEHESIELLVTTDSVLLRVLVAVFAIVVAPFFEELLFRGYLQTAVSTHIQKPWIAIMITALLFSMLHPWQHRVSLFFLACGLGYAYERSGSLFRSIMMHAIFNGLSVAVSLLQT